MVSDVRSDAGEVPSEGPSLCVFLPVIRDWTRETVCAAIAASDIPRGRLLLLLDAPGCEGWERSLSELGFHVEVTATGNGYPPEDRIERRSRWRAMRRFSQTLVPDGPTLFLEDDVLVCPDLYARLFAAGPNATGIVRGRYKGHHPVVYPLSSRCGTGVEPIAGCGYNCLLTTGEAYRAALIGDGDGPTDFEHTSQVRPLVADWGCKCGHLTPNGTLTL